MDKNTVDNRDSTLDDSTTSPCVGDDANSGDKGDVLAGNSEDNSDTGKVLVNEDFDATGADWVLLSSSHDVDNHDEEAS